MAVYVDNMQAEFGRMKMCHMIADSEHELAEMAKKIGVNLKWWQYKGTRKSHFDICMSKRTVAVDNGALEVSVHEMGFMLQPRKSAADPLAKPRMLLREELAHGG